MENEKFMKDYLIVTDYVHSDGESDVSDAIQKVIDEIPTGSFSFLTAFTRSQSRS